MNEYKVESVKLVRKTSDKNNLTTCADEAHCLREIHDVGVERVKSVSKRNSTGTFARLTGPEYLRLWKAYRAGDAGLK